MLAFVSKAVLFLRLMLLPIFALIAFALIAFGVSLIYFPAGWIIGGLLLLLAVIDSRS